MEKYKVFFCNKCKKVQMSSAKERLKCIACGKTTKIDGYVFTTDNPGTASQAVRDVAEHISKSSKTKKN